MRLNWWNARDAVEAGTRLADHLRPPDGWDPSEGRQSVASVKPGRDVEGLLQRTLREVPPLRLNFYKRARLLNSFKWRLRERGYDRGAADQLTQMLLFQLCGTAAKLGASGDAEVSHGTRASARRGAKSGRRIPVLLAEGEARFADGKYAEAARRLQEVLAIDPRHADAHAKLGAALCCVGRFDAAEQALRCAIRIKPTCAAAHLTLGNLLRDKGQFAASETALRRAVKQDPQNPSFQASLGLTLGIRNRLSEARACFDLALHLQPRDAGILCSQAWLAGIEGRFEDAEKFCRAALDSNSRHPGAWALLAGSRRMTDEDGDWIDGVERTLAAGVPPIGESKLRYAMGKYFDDLGKYQRAFEEYKRANELQKRLAAPYARAERTQRVDQLIGLYTRERLAQRAKGACESARPVFVTGMMRSGTTLVEQIIASHPLAMGAGELDFWGAAARKHEESFWDGGQDEPLTRNLGESFLRLLKQHSPDALRVVDKSNFNTDHLGLIHLVLPHARLIHVQRDPVDNCLSCYFQDFANVPAFTMDLSDLAHYYREHHRLICHWRATLPEGAILQVPYAELVADPGTWSRRIIEFIGLEWDSRCLQFHETQRPVFTASNWQVRQRIYSSSVGRWRKYERFIRPLLELRQLEAA